MIARPIRKPRFLWQGLLIVLPALLLAVLGLVSLRQDELLARHETAEHARKIATELAQVLLPGEFRRDPLPVLKATGSGGIDLTPIAPEAALINSDSGYEQPSRRITCLVNKQGGLVDPPPLSPLPAPQPLDASTLEEPLKTDWEAAQQAEFIAQDMPGAVAGYRRFLLRNPTGSFAAVGHYRLGRLHQRLGEIELARPQFEIVINDAQKAVGETGLPLRILAQLQLLELATATAIPADQRAALVKAICRDVVMDLPAMAPACLERLDKLAGEAGEIIAGWRQIMRVQQTARGLHARFLRAAREVRPTGDLDFRPRWLNLATNQLWLALPQPDADRYWVRAISETEVREIMGRLAGPPLVPAYFGVSVEIAGRTLVTNTASVLATATGSLPGQSDLTDLKVTIHLTDPDTLYARQRSRTWRFGALIVLSVVAVLVGFAAAWQAFRRQQQLSEMKSNFVSSVSHELRAPIASVRLMAEELNDVGGQDPAKSGKYHRFIIQECRRLSALIENVLDFSRHEQGRKHYEYEPTELVALVEATVGLMQTYGTPKGISIFTQFSGAPIEVEADGRALQQVLVNLIDNAIKHSPNGSTVTVGLEFPAAPQAGPSPVQDPSRHPAGMVRLWVEDRGEGIPPEEHTRIFERFYRRGSELRRETEGVGLGLAIVKYVTEAHGGRVTVRSAMGQGSRFTVELPVEAPKRES